MKKTNTKNSKKASPKVVLESEKKDLNKKSFGLMKVYLMIVSVGGIIGISVCLGIVLYQTLKMNRISDEEYIQSQGYYELEYCTNQSYYEQKPVGEVQEVKSDFDVEKCKNEKIANLKIRRSVQYKETMVGALSWGFVFLILFISHFPFFLRREKK